MTLVRALLPLFERLDDYEEAVETLQASVTAATEVTGGSEEAVETLQASVEEALQMWAPPWA